MARRPKPPAAPPASEPGFTRNVVSRPVEGARQLVTVGPDHVAWRGWNGKMPIGADGAIVRVRPPESATEEEVRQVEANLLSTGAVAVRVEWPKRSKAVPDQREARPHARAPEVVRELARGASVEDPEKVLGFCEQVMARVGLG